MEGTDPGRALPNGDQLVDFAQRLRTSGDAVRDDGAAVLHAWRAISVHYEAPEADRLFVAMNPVERVTDDHAGLLSGLADVIEGFADDVRTLEATQAALLRNRTQLAVEKVAETESGADWRDDPDLVSRETELLRCAAGLRAALADAQDRTVARVNALAIDHFSLVTSTPGAHIALTGSAAWSTVLPAFDCGIESTDIGLLNSLLHKGNLADWAATHPTRLRELVDAHPDAAAVREWWSGLDRASRDALIAGVPLVVGNLDGIVLADRASANRKNIRAAIADLEKQNAALRALGMTYDSSYRPQSGSEANAARITAYEKLIASFRLLLDNPRALTMQDDQGISRRLTPPVIVAFDPARESFVQYTGLLDPKTGELPETTRSIAVIVPGTGTNPTNWQSGEVKAKNVISSLPAGSQVGIFTWAGGHFPQGVDAASAEDSELLGPRLANFTNAVRPTTSAALTGVGYSYGGAVLGVAERTGLEIDRSLAVSSAGLGHGVDSVADYPDSSAIPHYSTMAPRDVFVGPSQGLEAGPLGHGASPLKPESGYTRLETGYVDSRLGRASGQMTGHTGVWSAHSDVVVQAGQVIKGGKVDLYARPEIEFIGPSGVPRRVTNPIMSDDYRPETIQVAGGHD